MPWLSRRWLAAAVLTTGLSVILVLAVEVAGIDTNIDTGDNAAKGVLFVAFALAAASWCGLLLHACRFIGKRLLRRLGSGD